MQVRMRPEKRSSESAAPSIAALERLLVLSGIAALLVLGGAHLQGWRPGETGEWSAAHGWLVFGMWSAMMVAIMTPGAASTLLAYAKRSRDLPAQLALPAFLAGHLALWLCISAAASLAHWGLHAAQFPLPGIDTASPVAGGVLLMCAGAYQLTPLKAACLAGRRTPSELMPGEWRDGAAGAFAMGLRHAMRCVGRCWLLMGLLFVGGIMSPLWIVVLTLIAMAERILPFGESIAHGVAVGAIGWGLWMLAGMLV